MGQDVLDSDRAGAGAIVLMAGATACYALSGVLIGRWLRHVPAFALGFAQVGFSTLYLLPIALGQEPIRTPDFHAGSYRESAGSRGRRIGPGDRRDSCG